MMNLAVTKLQRPLQALVDRAPSEQWDVAAAHRAVQRHFPKNRVREIRLHGSVRSSSRPNGRLGLT